MTVSSPPVADPDEAACPTGTITAALRHANPTLQTTVVSKAAMLRASRIVEHLVRDTDDVLVIAGFQHERHWRAEQPRYDLMAAPSVALAMPSTVDESDGSFVPLPPGHPLAREWFVTALGPSLSVTLCGLDLGRATGSGPMQRGRMFDAIFSTDRKLAHETLEHIAHDSSLRLPETALGLLQAPTYSREWERRRTRAPGSTGHVLRAVLERIEVVCAEELRREDEHDRQALAVRTHERQRLVGLVHDGALQRLLVAAQDLAELERPDDPEQTELLDEAHNALHEGIAQLRRDLSSAYDATPLVDSLEQRLEAVALHYATRGRFSADVVVKTTSTTDLDDDIVACVRELLANTAKHAEATEVVVRVHQDDDALEIHVRDNGTGMDPGTAERARANGHLGLTLARDRVRAAGGTWTMHTSPGKGVRVHVRLPLARAAG